MHYENQSTNRAQSNRVQTSGIIKNASTFILTFIFGIDSSWFRLDWSSDHFVNEATSLRVRMLIFSQHQ